MARNDFKIEWEGIEAFHRELMALNATVEREVALLVKTYALDCQAKIREKLTANKSVVTGNLRRSIAIAEKDKFTHDVYSPVVYAPYVEYGTRRASAKPYFKPVYDSIKNKFKEDIQEIFRGYE